MIASNIIYRKFVSATAKLYWKYQGSFKDNIYRTAFEPFQATSADSVDSFNIPSLTRGTQKNFVAKWQEKGDYYVRFSTLQMLNAQLEDFSKSAASSKEQKIKLLNDLTLTYFARLHNLIREEYQYEKSLGKIFSYFY